MDFITIILVLIAVAGGFAVGWFMGLAPVSRLEERNESLQQHEKEQVERMESERLRALETQKSLEEQLERERLRAGEAEKSLAEQAADFRNLKERLEEQKKDFEKMQVQFREQFENLANSILEEKSRKFTEQNREKLDQLLKPLGEKIEEFRKRVEDGHKEDIRGRSALEQHLKTLQSLNQTMSDEAKNLTKALKGDTKRQGNWGEVILERILERSGLQKGREYDIQQSFTTSEGNRLQPDVIINLPDEKHLVVDSKVSLTAYERFSSADDEAGQMKALREHITSLRAHVKGLSVKNYQQVYDHNSPDFILLFIPIEPAFGLAMQNDPELYNEAFERNIIIVSPTTLLATLATINNVWKQEYQNKNAMEIASRGGLLYDKFVSFTESMKDIGKRISQASDSYDEAMGRLSGGPGNLVRQADMLRELGAKSTKKIPDELVDNSRGGENLRLFPDGESPGRESRQSDDDESGGRNGS